MCAWSPIASRVWSTKRRLESSSSAVPYAPVPRWSLRFRTGSLPAWYSCTLAHKGKR